MNANDDRKVDNEYGDFGDGAEGNRFTLADESEITDEMIQDVEGSKPSELMIMKDVCSRAHVWGRTVCVTSVSVVSPSS